ncbi:MAG: SRPBCC family protein, partial [Burkholderiales bacterium]
LTPQLAGLWLFATASRPMMNVSIDARTGGTFCFVERWAGTVIQHRGKYLEITRPRCLVFTLASGDGLPDDTRVSIGIAALRAGCELQLTHDHLPAAHADRMAARWTGILYGLGRTLAHLPPENRYS